MSSRSRRHRHHLLISAALLLLLPLTSATDHIVGGHLGWNPNINYSSWSNNQTFYVGDLISFRYTKNMYNVFEVNETGYDNCTTDGAVGNWSSGKDFIPLGVAKRYYFIGGNGYCLGGMKVKIRVQPLPSPPSHSGGQHADSRASGVAPLLCERAVAGLVVALAAWIGI